MQKFFSSVNDKMKNLGTKTTINNLIKWSNEEKELNEKFSKAKHSVHKALCGKLFGLLIVAYIILIGKCAMCAEVRRLCR